MLRTPQGDLSYMYFTPRDLINFQKGNGNKFTNKVPTQHQKRQSTTEDNNYIVASSPANQFIPGVAGGPTITRRPKFQQTFFKQAPPKLINPMLSKSVNSNISKQEVPLPRDSSQ